MNRNPQITRPPITSRPTPDYTPHWLLRSGNLQTVLAQRVPADAYAVNATQQPLLLDGGPDHTGMDSDQNVRLLAYYTPRQPATAPQGLVLLLHGWEGCSHSAYNLLVGSALIRAGYHVLRLNLRDHGGTHHLNPGIFYSTLIEEVHTATKQAALLAGDAPFSLIGASLGGSFVVRMALRHAQDPIPNLRQVIAVNPAINPQRASHLLDSHQLLRRYFRSRWLASLRKKQALFPTHYDFTPLEKIPTIRAMTDWLCKRYSPFPGVDDYLNAYAVPPAAFRDLPVPLTILTAANDPIIHPQDFHDLPRHPLLQAHVLPFGGHVAYNDLFPLRSRLPDLILPFLNQPQPIRA